MPPLCPGISQGGPATSLPQDNSCSSPSIIRALMPNTTRFGTESGRLEIRRIVSFQVLGVCQRRQSTGPSPFLKGGDTTRATSHLSMWNFFALLVEKWRQQCLYHIVAFCSSSVGFLPWFAGRSRSRWPMTSPRQPGSAWDKRI
jgi:hypothetical protein